MKLGILRETKTPPDRRVALPPMQIVKFKEKFPHVEIVVQPSNIRAYKDEEYKELGVVLQEDLSDCDVLIGLKEVEVDKLIPGKKYLFFSHTAKKQPFNKELLQSILQKKIQLIDYEYLTNKHGQRLVAFGRWAGIVGAYNALYAYGKRSNLYNLKRAHECHDMDEFFGELMKISLPPIKILLSGGGRVAHGAMETLSPMAIRKISPQKFLTQEFPYPVYTQIDPWDYTKRKDGGHWDLENFFKYPEDYESTFKPYTKAADLYIACHFWDPKAPRFFTQQDMSENDFRMKVIADVSCDINGPIPSTIRPASIAEPLYAYNPASGKEEASVFAPQNITVMAVDNLPGEAPRNSSIDFGDDLIEKVLPALIYEDNENIIERATIAIDGKLGHHFNSLKEWSES
jgi:alanine dehydrogenase